MKRLGPWAVPGDEQPEVSAVLELVVAAKPAGSPQLEAAVAAFYQGARQALPTRGAAGEHRAGRIAVTGALPLLAAVAAVAWMLHVWPAPRPPTEAFFKLVLGIVVFLGVSAGGYALATPVMLYLASGAAAGPEAKDKVAAILSVARGRSLLAVARERRWSPEDLHAWGQAWLDGGVAALGARR